jgi:16S rRNA G966 N2-methylase RsmD
MAETPDEGNHMMNRASTNNLRRSCIPSIILAFVFSLFVLAQEVPLPPELSFPDSNKTVPYVPTPPEVVNKMLELAKVGPNDIVYDLGSGDGRIVIMAVEKYGAQALGVELDDERVKQSSARIMELGLEKRAKIIRGNLFETDLRPATVVTLYLLPSVNQRLRPSLEKDLRAGARVVSHDFMIEGWQAEQTVMVTSENGMSHTVYLYVLPQPQAATGSKESGETERSN